MCFCFFVFCRTYVWMNSWRYNKRIPSWSTVSAEERDSSRRRGQRTSGLRKDHAGGGNEEDAWERRPPVRRAFDRRFLLDQEGTGDAFHGVVWCTLRCILCMVDALVCGCTGGDVRVQFYTKNKIEGTSFRAMSDKTEGHILLTASWK